MTRNESSLGAFRFGVDGGMYVHGERVVLARVTDEMIDRGVVALLEQRPPIRPDHAAPILEARREVQAVLRAALEADDDA